METSLFLAQVFGLYFIFAGMAILIRPTAVIELMEAFSNRAHMLIAGFAALIVGIPLVLIHNIWDGSWRVMVTLLVWTAFLKGVALIFAPDVMSNWMSVFRKYPNLMRHLVWLVIIFGLYLAYVGFGWKL